MVEPSPDATPDRARLADMEMFAKVADLAERVGEFALGRKSKTSITAIFERLREPVSGATAVLRSELAIDFSKIPLGLKSLAPLVADLDAIREAVLAQPDRFRSLVRSLVAGRLDDARTLVRELGISESQLLARGGGAIFLLAAALVFLGVVVIGDEPAPVQHEEKKVIVDERDAADLSKLDPTIFRK